MLLNLESPVGANFLKDWPSQNSVNCDRIDEYAGPCLTTSPILDYVPILTASVTSPTMGTGGTLVGKYYTIFDQVYVWGEFRFGVGFSAGSGNYRISLPFPAKTLVSINNPFDSPVPVGGGQIYQAADANRQGVSCTLGSPDYLTFSVRMGTGGGTRGVSNIVPVVWAGGSPGDGMMWHARYQRQE